MSTIPYDPSLVLGMVINPSRIKDLELVSNAQKNSNSANQDQKQISSAINTPIDLSKSTLVKKPLAADSMNMDVQYFQCEQNKESTNDHAEAVSAFVSTKISRFLGPAFDAQVRAASNKSIASILESDEILGTIAFCANCTQKDMHVLSPMVLDVDNAIESYSTFMGVDFPTQDPQQMRKIAVTATKPGNADNALPVLAGAAYGASLVGFVHITKREKTTSFQAAQMQAAQVEASIRNILFASSVSGSVGVGEREFESVKTLMSTFNLQSHCSLINLGIIPSIKSDSVMSAVKEMEGGPEDRMKQLAAMQDGSNSTLASMDQKANDAKNAAAMEKMSADSISASINSLSDIDNSSNKIIDMNSMMTAMDDYIMKVSQGSVGVPINFYLKYVTQRTIAMEWMKKYYPSMLSLEDTKNDEED